MSERIKNIFSSVAKKYDLLNTIISIGLHKRWRRTCINMLRLCGDENILDLCCGTGDFAFEAQKKLTSGSITGVDFCEEMIEIARKKAHDKKKISFVIADALNLPFYDKSFDCVTIGFGIRNFTDINKGLSEIARVTNDGGRLCSLDITHTDNKFFKVIWNIYFYKLMPFFSQLLNKNKNDAYNYLAESVKHFLTPSELSERMLAAGFGQVEVKKKIFGTICIHIAYKNQHGETLDY